MCIRDSKDSIKKLWLLSEELTPEKNIFEYTQGIMDLGATVCSARSPICINCPVSNSCRNSFNDFEMRSKAKKERPKKKISFVLAYSNDSFLLFKKNENSFWQSLWIPYNKDSHSEGHLFKQPIKRKKIYVNNLLSKGKIKYSDFIKSSNLFFSRRKIIGSHTIPPSVFNKRAYLH